MTSTEPFVEGLHFGEAPRWHDDRLWYSDFFDHAVFSVGDGAVGDDSGGSVTGDGASDRRREVEVAGRPSGLGWLPDGRLLVVSMTERAVLRREGDGSLVHHGDLDPWAGGHGNDMVVSAGGRAYVGNFGFDLSAFYDGKAEQHATSLVRIDPDGTSQEAATDLEFPNGAVISPDGRTMVVAESMASRLTAFDVAPDGALSGRREWARIEHCAPDGICLDAEGCIWVANAVAAECLRVAEGGEVVARVETGQPCFACMLGGADRRTLYCCTAPTSVETEARDRRDGRIERTEVAVGGAGLP